MCSPVIFCLWCTALFVTVSGTPVVKILDPIRTSEDEVALIFIPGAKLKGDQFKQVAQVIQRASELRIWIALTDNYFQDVPSPFQLNSALKAAVKALKQSGMKSKNYVGVGHSLGGISLRSFAKRAKLKAVVLMASFVARKFTSLMKYPVPVLTLAAELDGQTRITRIVEEYAKLQQDVLVSQDAVHRAPVICIKGANHGQFASGPMPPRVREMNPQPDITEAEVHDRIAEYVNSFITGVFSSNMSQVANARRKLEKDFVKSGELFQPLLDVKALHEPKNSVSCPWAITAQKYLAGEYADKIEVNTEVLGNIGFIVSKPKISGVENKAVINTTVLVDYDWHLYDRPSPPQSPKEIHLKLKTKPAIQQALGLNVTGDEPKPSCLALNELALEVALNRSTLEARDRYRMRGRAIIFEEDNVRPIGILWVPTPQQTWEDEAGLHVRAAALTTPIRDSTYPGSFYCKLMAPYRALEWILIDSLKPYQD